MAGARAHGWACGSVRANRAQPALDPAPYRSIHSMRAADYALWLARQFRSRITWLHVVEHPAPEPLSREYLTRFFCSRLAELLPPEARDWCQPQYRVEFGEPAEMIPRVAQRGQRRQVFGGRRLGTCDHAYRQNSLPSDVRRSGAGAFNPWRQLGGSKRCSSVRLNFRLRQEDYVLAFRFTAPHRIELTTIFSQNRAPETFWFESVP